MISHAFNIGFENGFAHGKVPAWNLCPFDVTRWGEYCDYIEGCTEGAEQKSKRDYLVEVARLKPYGIEHLSYNGQHKPRA